MSGIPPAGEARGSDAVRRLHRAALATGGRLQAVERDGLFFLEAAPVAGTVLEDAPFGSLDSEERCSGPSSGGPKEACGLGLVFTTRLGGVSRAGYASLNLSWRSGDDPEAVCQNRAALCSALGLVPGALVSPVQVHEDRVVDLGEFLEEGAAVEADGIVVASAPAAGAPTSAAPTPCAPTSAAPAAGAPVGPAATLLKEKGAPGRGALLLFADCVPVVLVGKKAAAVLHCGWRGLLGGAIAAGARTLDETPLLAFVGPSIGPCCYEVGSDVAGAFSERFGEGIVSEEGRLDLWECAARALAEVGLLGEVVVNPRLCTSCNPDLFYSHRRDGAEGGRQGAAVYDRTLVGRKKRVRML